MIDYNKVLSRRAVELKPSGIRKFFDIAAEMKDVISLGVGEPDFKTPWSIRHAGIESLERGHTFYTANAGVNFSRTSPVNSRERPLRSSQPGAPDSPVLPDSADSWLLERRHFQLDFSCFQHLDTIH